MSISCQLLATFLGCHWVPWIFTFLDGVSCKCKKLSPVCWVSLTRLTPHPTLPATLRPAHPTSHRPIRSHQTIVHQLVHHPCLFDRHGEPSIGTTNRPDTVPNGGGKALLILRTCMYTPSSRRPYNRPCWIERAGSHTFICFCHCLGGDLTRLRPSRGRATLVNVNLWDQQQKPLGRVKEASAISRLKG
jgi:hypothetical protein